ncbi:IS1 family transposase [Raoultella ornithinolytica]|uniref:IS1 family transposase n=1 Tax=Raoultella ornithinolytica TaxID=54291 RepID=UPI003977681C
MNLRQHLARLGRKSLSFSKSVELHDKVIGHYLNINTISKLESLPKTAPYIPALKVGFTAHWITGASLPSPKTNGMFMRCDDSPRFFSWSSGVYKVN